MKQPSKDVYVGDHDKRYDDAANVDPANECRKSELPSQIGALFLLVGELDLCQGEALRILASKILPRPAIHLKDIRHGRKAVRTAGEHCAFGYHGDIAEAPF